MMKQMLVACGCMLILGFGTASDAIALPGLGGTRPNVIEADQPMVLVQSRVGYWRKRYDRAQYRRYRGNPGAQYELRQKRQNLCRNVPEMC